MASRPNMQRLRLLVLLGTLLTLPVYGLAGIAYRTCDPQVSAAGQTDVPADCCSGKFDQNAGCKQDGQVPGGKNAPSHACKASCGCASTHSYEPVSGWLVTVAVTHGIASADPPTLLSSRAPDGLWRPPPVT